MGKFLILLLVPFIVYSEDVPMVNGVVGDNLYVISKESLDNNIVSFSYTSFYFLKEIQDYKIIYCIPIRDGRIGGEYSFFGGRLYNENSLNILFVHNNSNLSYGLRVGGKLLNMLNEKADLQYKIDLFASYHLNSSAIWSIYFNDIQNILYNEAYTMGTKLLYNNDIFMVYGEMKYNSDESINFKILSGYIFGKNLMLYLGGNSSPNRFILGVGFNCGKTILTNDIQLQRELGIQESINITFRFNTPIKEERKKEVIRYDLNTVTFEQLFKAGVESDICCAIIDYRSEIGQYFDISDLMNIAGIGVSWMKTYSGMFKVNWERININKVNLTRFLTTPGINKVILKRIIKYRETHKIRDMYKLIVIKGVDKEIIGILKRYYKCEV